MVERRGKGFGCRPYEVLWLQRGRQGYDVGRYKKDADGVALVCSLLGTISPFRHIGDVFQVAKDQMFSYTSSSQYLSLASPSSFLQ